MAEDFTETFVETVSSWEKQAWGWLDRASRAIFPKALLPVSKGFDKFNNYVLKPVIRESLIASQDAGTLFEWSLSKIYEDARDMAQGKSTPGSTMRGFSEQFITTQREGLGGVGTGYLPGGPAFAESQQGIQQARPRVGSHAFTLGRAAAYPGVQFGIYDEDSITHQLISGSIDLYKVVKNPLDPFNRIGRLAPGGTGAESIAAKGRTRFDDAKEFNKYFNDLEDKVIDIRDNVQKPVGLVYTKPEQALIDEYNKLVTPLPATRTKTYPALSANAGAVADTYDSAAVYSHWKPILDEAFNDISNNVGLINDIAPSFVRNNFQRWRQSGDGTTWAQDIIDKVRSGELDVQTIWKSPMFGRDGIGTAVRLIEELKDPLANTDTVFNIIDNAVNDFNPLYNVRKAGLSRVEAIRTSGGAIVKTAAQKFGVRQLEVFPESFKIGFTDPAQSARNIDDVMGLFGFDYVDRNQWLTRWAKASQGSKADVMQYLNDFQEQAVRIRLQNTTMPITNRQIFDDDLIREMTSWSQKVADETMQYTIDDTASGVPLGWLDNTGIGPLRISQLLSNDFYITPPQFIDDIIEATGKISAFKSVLRETPVIGKAVQGQEVVTTVIRNYMSRYWKPSRVAKVSHLIRVVPEEIARSAASGIFEHPMEQMLAMIGRTMGTDAAGNPIVGKIPNIVKMNRELSEVQETLREALQYETKLNTGGVLTKKQEQLVNSIPDLRTKTANIEAKLNADPQSITEVLIGPRSRGAQATATGEYKGLWESQVRRGTLQLPDRTIPNEQRGWLNGISHELSDMVRNPDYQRIATSNLLQGDRLTINGVTRTINNHILAGEIHPFTTQPLANDIDAVKLWLYQGTGRKYFEAYFADVNNLKPQYLNNGWDNYATASERVDTILNKDIAYLTGLDPKLLDVIATGNFDNLRATFIDPKTGRGKVSKELFDYLKTDFINRPHAPNKVRNFVQPKFDPTAKNVGLGLESGLNRLFKYYFEDMYGRASDLASRSPVWKASYWSRMEELASSLTPIEAQKLVEAAVKAKLIPTRLERIEIQAALANGKGTVEGAELLANSFARKSTNDLLFNANKKSLFGKQHAILFPFFEVFREVTGTWLKLLAQNPRIIRNVGQSIGTAQEEGWFYTDVNGRKVFELPMTSSLARVFAGTKNSVIDNFTVGVNAINIASQMKPGFGPVVQVAGTFLPKSANFDWLRKILSPYGQPDVENFEIQSLFAPAYLKQAAARTQKGESVWSGVSKAVLGNVRNDDYYQRAYLRIAQFLASTNEKAYFGVDGQKRLFEDAENMTFKIVEMRGLAAFFGPGAPMTTWLAHTKYGAVDVGIIMDDLYNKEVAATNAGEQPFTAFGKWLDQWGEIVWPYVTSLTESTVGGQVSTNEYQKWSRSNGYILGKYPTVAGYFGPREGLRTFDAWQQQLNVNTRNIGDPKENIAKSQNRLGNYLYYKFLDQIPENELKSVAARQQKADNIILIEEQLPGWQRPGSTNEVRKAETRDKIAELRAITVDPKLQNLPIVKAVTDYLMFRDQAIEFEITKTNGKVTQTNWVDAKAARGVRDYLSMVVAPALIAQVPGFRDLYEQVLSYEFIVDED